MLSPLQRGLALLHPYLFSSCLPLVAGSLILAAHQAGAWVRKGENTFALTFLALRFDPQGHFAGTTKVRAQANLSEDGNTYTGPGFTEMFDATGKLLASFKSTAQATRITVEPL